MKEVSKVPQNPNSNWKGDHENTSSPGEKSFQNFQTFQQSLHHHSPCCHSNDRKLVGKYHQTPLPTSHARQNTSETGDVHTVVGKNKEEKGEKRVTPYRNNTSCIKSLQCPFWVMSYGPYMGKLRSQDPSWQQMQLVTKIAFQHNSQCSLQTLPSI